MRPSSGRGSSGVRSSRRQVLSSLVAVVVVGCLGLGFAWAQWSAGSAPGGRGSAAAATIDPGTTPTAAAAGDTVSVAWASSTLSNGDPVEGYRVRRYDASTLSESAVLPGCAGVIADTACSEAAVPEGEWLYSVTPVLGIHWVGSESPNSDSVTIDVTPPVNDITLSGVSGGAYMAGADVYYRGVASGAFTLSNSVSDAGSGPASSSTAALTGSATGWSHEPSTVSAPAGGPYTSNTFSWAPGTTSSPGVSVTGRDAAGNAALANLTLVDDSTPPAGSLSYADGYQVSGPVSITFVTGTDAGSGVGARQLQRAESSLTAGLCGSFTAFADLGPDGPTSAYSDTTVTDGNCYRYQYLVTDRVGNRTTATSSAVVKVDSASGGPVLRSASSYSVLAGTGVANTGATQVSGDLGVSPSNSVSGFPPGVVAGTIHAGDAAAAQAQLDLELAYQDADARTPTSEFAGDLNGRTFQAGVHHTAAAMGLTGSMTLDAQGDPNAIFVFQVDAAMNTAAGSHVLLTNGALASHVFWQVLGASGTGANSTFAGTILSAGAITLGDSTELIGRALSMGTVTLATNAIRFTSAPPPSVTITGGSSAVTKDSTPTLSGTTTAIPGSTVTATVAGQQVTGTVQADATWSVTTAALTAGVHHVVVSVRDAAGNAGTASQDLTVEINPPMVALGAAGTFSVLAGVGVVNTGETLLSGDLGVSPGTSIVGFPPGIVAGTVHPGDATAAQAQADLVLAYDDVNSRTAHTEFAGDLNGRTFHAGVHHSTAALSLTGTMTLDAEGDPNAVFIFQVDAALNTAAASHVNLANGAQASRVFWQVEGAAGTGANSTFAGNILAAGGITLGAGTQLTGRALSYDTVTLSTNTIQ